MSKASWNPTSIILRLAVMAGVSTFFLGMMFRLIAEPGDAERAGVVDLFSSLTYGFAAIYLVLALVQVVCRAARYQLFLKAGGEGVLPSLGALCKVTLVRNMVVDLLPARLGELMYVGVLRQSCGVSVGGGMTSMGFSLIFDIISLWILVMALAAIQMLGGTMTETTLYLLIGLGVLSAIAWWGVFFGMPYVVKVVDWMKALLKGRLGSTWVLGVVTDAAREVARIRTAGIVMKALALSLLVRICKYTGYYFCFMAVTSALMPTLAAAGPWRVVLAAIVSEATASVPVPAFMGFGLYEAGGTAIWVAFGFPKAEAFIAVLSAHILSQIVDYTLGGLGMLTLWWGMPRKVVMASDRPRITRRLIGVAALLGIVLLFAAFEWRRVSKRGSLHPPSTGVAVAGANLVDTTAIKTLKGCIVWSSNRGGNHDLYEMSLPSGEVRQLTTHAHTDTFPAYSPDGRHIAFARSHVPWVSQRNGVAWDVWLLDRSTGVERLIAKAGREPRWVDSNSLVFARDAASIVTYNLESKQESIVMKVGTGDITAKSTLHTASLHKESGMLALTIGGHGWMTALIDPAGKVSTVAKGCQIAWQPGSKDLVWMEPQGGELKNAIYVRESGQDRRLLDMPLPFSHEYFPKFSQDRRWLVFGACGPGGHEHDTSDYEIFLWQVGQPAETATRLTFHTGNDCWPDIRLE